MRRRLRGDWAESWAEDVVQNGVAGVLRGFRVCRAGTDAELLAWLGAIARREVASFYRREAQRTRTTVPLTAVTGEAGTTEPPLTLAPPLRAAIDALSATQHRMLWLRLQAGASWAEVALELGLPPSAAKRRYQRLLARLRAQGAPAPSSPSPASLPRGSPPFSGKFQDGS